MFFVGEVCLLVCFVVVGFGFVCVLVLLSFLRKSGGRECRIPCAVSCPTPVFTAIAFRKDINS